MLICKCNNINRINLHRGFRFNHITICVQNIKIIKLECQKLKKKKKKLLSTLNNDKSLTVNQNKTSIYYVYFLKR